MHKRIWPTYRPASASPDLKELEDHIAHVQSDISDYLVTLFSETVAAQPHLIVELGVRGGESRLVLERAATFAGSLLVSVDLDDCSAACGQSPLWHFVKADDVQFGQGFNAWCLQRGIEPGIDVLFIDTSHLFEHTLQEIKAWFPHLSPSCRVIFHDTNARGFYRRVDGTIGFSRYGLKIKRGVIRAIEEYLGARFNERIDFVTTVHGWLIRHWAHCNGLTVMERTGRSCINDEDSVGNKPQRRSQEQSLSHG